MAEAEGSDMKKLIAIASLIMALMAVVLSGCSTSVKAFTDDGQTINTEVNKEFTVALGSNISTGYSWQVEYDENTLALLEKTYKEQDNTGKQLVGASGTEYFKFKVLTRGDTKVTFTYRRPWEQPSAQDQTLVFTISAR